MAEISATSFPSSSSASLALRSSLNGWLSMYQSCIFSSSENYRLLLSIVIREYSKCVSVLLISDMVQQVIMEMSIDICLCAGSLRCQNVACLRTTSLFQEVFSIRIDIIIYAY